MMLLLKRTFRCLAFTALLVTASPALAQDNPATEASAEDGDRATAFRTSAGPQVDRVPGGKLLIGAYGLAWLAILGFMWFRIDRQQKRANGELERLASVVDRHLKEK